MATPKVIPFPSTAQVPPTIQIPQEITQGDLSYILATRLEIQRLKTNLTEAEESLKFRLEAGARVESGVFRTWLKEHFRRAVAWREVAERVANRLYGDGRGHGYCEGVLKSTKPTRTVQLVVS